MNLGLILGSFAVAMFLVPSLTLVLLGVVFAMLILSESFLMRSLE